MKTGIIGCGNIMKAYGKSAGVYANLHVGACADLDLERARQAAAEFDIPKACSVEELLADETIDVVLNLTIPGAHAEVDAQAIDAGKHVYSEKPLALSREEILPVLTRAAERELRVGCAPDTFLFGNALTGRAVLDEGAIGSPFACTCNLLCHGHETWHPSPQFYYQPGGGPLFDMGPYYLTMLVNCLGPVKRISGVCGKGYAERTITSEPLAGTVIPVECETHIVSTLEFVSGAMGSLTMSFDVWKHGFPGLQIYGTEGTLDLGDPNTFNNPVKVSKRGADWEEIPARYEDGMRGAGLSDMLDAITVGRPHRASGELALHVLDIMQSAIEAGREGRAIELQTTCERPAAIPDGEQAGLLKTASA